MTVLSATLLLLLVMDPFGNVPLFMAVLEPVRPERRRAVIVRELLLALAFLLTFLFGGRYLLAAIGITEDALTVSGGIILFMIALRMVFPPPGGAFANDVDEAESEPLLVPLAVPFLAGPSALASLLFIMNQDPARWPAWLAATVIAWAVTGIVLLASPMLSRWLGRRGLVAIERLMGMVLTAIATKMVMSGIAKFYGVGLG